MALERLSSLSESRTRNIDPGLKSFFQQIYNTMAGGLVTTGLVAFAVSHNAGLMRAIYGNPVISMIVMLAPLGFSLALNSVSIMRMKFATATGLFYLFSAVLGLSLSYIFVVYTQESIARVFFITAIMFAGMSIFGYTTKKDLSGMGSLMIMGMWGVFIAVIVNLFMQSSALSFATSVIGVIVYTGLVGWETQLMKQTYNANNGYLSNSKLAIIGALGLYINFINIFLFMLRLMGGGNRN